MRSELYRGMFLSVTKDTSNKVTDYSELNILEHQIWKDYCPIYYDFIYTIPLSFQSLTVQWLPYQEKTTDNFLKQRLILATFTERKSRDYLQVVELEIPLDDAVIDSSTYKTDGSFGNLGGIETKPIKVISRMFHPTEINRARYMPQNSDLIAVISSEAVWVYNSKQPKEKPIKLEGQTEEGYGLSWSNHIKGNILSGSFDQYVRTWNIENQNKLFSYKLPNKIGDASWHPRDANYFGAACDNGNFYLFDTRTKEPTISLQAHSEETNCLSFNPIFSELFATGSSDTNIHIWDVRNLSQPLRKLKGHSNGVFVLSWNPLNPSVLGSCGDDNVVILWDLSNQNHPILFQHNGHTDTVREFSWNENIPFVIASVSFGNILQIWEMNGELYSGLNQITNIPSIQKI
ncbi:wd40 repeat family [Anaeramoeba ignava]|uniref:Wd40 repeat family n=1 Tax=Anaeramoeba ignava TaxID=1746090 RepID=A0A9Q0L8L6_ANAIG|nr:wd40 repeat family [Anaeramoeba ignava]